MNRTYTPEDAPADVFEYYRYHPNLAGAIIFLIIFIVTTALHLLQLLWTRTWFFTPLVVGGAFEAIGYVGRILSTTDQYVMPYYLIQTLFILLSPALFAASIYMTLGRIITLLEAEKYSLIKIRFLTRFFVAGDVICFLMQGAGGGIMAGHSTKSLHTGEHIIIGGLIVQILFFGFFLITTIHFRLCMHRQPTAISFNIRWKRHITILLATSALILVRSVFRVIEYAQGNAGYILRHEIFLYIFDSLLMASVMVLLNVVHPSEILMKRPGGREASLGVLLKSLH